MKKYAAIDIGTNSMRLLLANVEAGKIVSKTKYINPTRIGSSVDKDKIISEEGMTKNIEAFYDFTQKAKEYGAEKILAIATSAVRDAANGKDFIQKAYKKTGVNIEVISGEEEATLGYKGVAMGITEEQSKKLRKEIHPHCYLSSDNIKNSNLLLVIDIGGGSTELILGQGPTLQKTISINVGAVRMTERFVTTDPISEEEYGEMEKTIYEIVKEAIEEIKAEVKNKVCASSALQAKEALPYSLIGIGGTITTLAALHQEIDPYAPNKVHNYKLTLENITTLKEKLSSLTIEQIKNLKGIHPKRADIILAGITILNTIMSKLDIHDITVSEYDNLEGLIHTNL